MIRLRVSLVLGGIEVRMPVPIAEKGRGSSLVPQSQCWDVLCKTQAAGSEEWEGSIGYIEGVYSVGRNPHKQRTLWLLFHRPAHSPLT